MCGAIPDDDRVDQVIHVTELMGDIDGLERVGDEYRDPDSWQTCPACRVDCPIDSETCFNCGAELEGSG